MSFNPFVEGIIIPYDDMPVSFRDNYDREMVEGRVFYYNGHFTTELNEDVGEEEYLYTFELSNNPTRRVYIYHNELDHVLLAEKECLHSKTIAE